MKTLTLLMSLSVAMVLVTGCSTTPATSMQRAELDSDVQYAISRAQREDPGMKRFFDGSAGYAVFPNVGKGAVAVGAAYGRGELFEKGVMTGYCTLTQATVRDSPRAHWLLGAAHRVANEHDEAEFHLHEALKRCRQINLVEFEACILVDLARLRVDQGNVVPAQRLAEEALVITERCGYVLQGADARLELAKLAFGRGDEGAGMEHAREAKRLATCDGPPDYTYKVAYDEACALLKAHGES